MRVWVPGGSGMLGTDVCALLRARGHEVLPTGREVDIAEPGAAEDFVAAARPTHIVNCAAYTAVDRCEQEEPLAYRVNAEGPARVGSAARKHGLYALHVSTDYVFAGDAHAPYREEDATGPLSAYGRTKLSGERGFLDATDGLGAVVRTSWLFGVHGGCFPATMLRVMGERDEVRVVDDQHGCPTFTGDLAAAIAELLAPRRAGVWHFANAGVTTWHAFAVAIRDAAAATGAPLRVRQVSPIPTSAWPTPARRPPWSVLSTEKIARALGTAPRPWSEALSHWFALRGAGHTATRET